MLSSNSLQITKLIFNSKQQNTFIPEKQQLTFIQDNPELKVPE